MCTTTTICSFVVLVPFVKGVWIDGDATGSISRVPWENIGMYTVWLFGIYFAMSIFLVLMTSLFEGGFKKKPSRPHSSVDGGGPAIQELGHLNSVGELLQKNSNVISGLPGSKTPS
eukprot:c21870_g1_i1.p2 GENE.c21870_g1_i1~~c21870_g1_i1.p2  ORF type:complete len:116 (+),score=47.29 c21870_g1_i1:660-1007(+)